MNGTKTKSENLKDSRGIALAQMLLESMLCYAMASATNTAYIEFNILFALTLEESKCCYSTAYDIYQTTFIHNQYLIYSICLRQSLFVFTLQFIANKSLIKVDFCLTKSVILIHFRFIFISFEIFSHLREHPNAMQTY